MGVARGHLGRDSQNISFQLITDLSKGYTAVEWTWWRHRNAKINIISHHTKFAPQSFL